MIVTLIVPGLCSCAPDALATNAALRRFARYAGPPASTRSGIEGAALDALGLAVTTPSAPLAAAGAGTDVANDFIVAATPVMLVPGLDDIIVVRRVIDLLPDETDALLALLNHHFRDDGLAFVAPRPSSWFARTRTVPRIVTTPLPAALGQPMSTHLAGGDDKRTWRRWQNEVQMLLHDHAINQRRESEGRPTVTGVWFWGGGRMADVPPTARLAIAATRAEAGDIARGLALRNGQTADDASAPFQVMLDRVEPSQHAVIALDDVDPPDLAKLGDGWLAPAVNALERRRIERLQIVADGNGGAVTWRAQRPSILARVSSRFSRRALAIPALPAE